MRSPIFSFSFYSAAHLSRARTLRDPLFWAGMKGVLISLPLECAAVCAGATADSCSYCTYTYFTTFLLVCFLCVADIPKMLNHAEKLPPISEHLHDVSSIFSPRLFRRLCLLDARRG